jgi:hypothetical protein
VIDPVTHTEIPAAAPVPPLPPPPDDPPTAAPAPAMSQPAVPVSAQLEFRRFADLAAEVDAAGPRQWLIRGIWPAGDYGVHAAEPKAQKTWNTADLAVSVATGTPWLGTFPIDTVGPVIVFHGEGGKASIVRRIRAVLAERSLDEQDLQVEVCVRAPHLGDLQHLTEFAARIEIVQPALVVLDPLYLSAGGANLRDLYEMGALLEAPQRICQAAGASFWVVHHFNRQNGAGAARITGAGPSEWGRVLVTATVKARHTHPDSLATDVVTELEIIGGEVPDRTIRVRRHIVADDPDDLDSPLRVTVTANDKLDQVAGSGDVESLPPGARKLLEAMEALDAPTSQKGLVDWIAETHGHGLKRETVSRYLNELADQHGLVDCIDEGDFKPKLWFLTAPSDSTPNGRPGAPEVPRSRGDHAGKRQNPSESPCDPCDVTRDVTRDERRVTRVTDPKGGHTSHGSSQDHAGDDPQGHTDAPLFETPV